MTQIAFKPGQKNDTNGALSIEEITDAAWQFAHAALWKDSHFNSKEIKAIKGLIAELFSNPEADNDAILDSFCERIMLNYRLQLLLPSFHVPHPEQWLKLLQLFGTEQVAQVLQMNIPEEELTGYRLGMFSVQNYFSKFIRYPTSRVFNGCCDQLTAYGEHSLLQLFINAVSYYKFGKQ